MSDSKLRSMPMPVPMGHDTLAGTMEKLKRQKLYSESSKGMTDIPEEERPYIEGITVAANGVILFNNMLDTEYTSEESAELIKALGELELDIVNLAKKLPLPKSVLDKMPPSYDPATSVPVPMMALVALVALNKTFEQMDKDCGASICTPAGFTFVDRALMAETFVRTWAIKSTSGQMYQMGISPEDGAANPSLNVLLQGASFPHIQEVIKIAESKDDGPGAEPEKISVAM